MAEQPSCCACGDPLSLEVGIVRIDGGTDPGLYCEPCAPTSGKGYTLSDLQRMKEDIAVGRAQRQIQLLEQLGPDVYFAVKGGET